jgi:carbon storage regulator
MLVLSRRRGESFVIFLPDGREITVTVVERGYDKMRLGIEAPADIVIMRSELIEGGKEDDAELH